MTQQSPAPKLYNFVYRRKNLHKIVNQRKGFNHVESYMERVNTNRTKGLKWIRRPTVSQHKQRRARRHSPIRKGVVRKNVGKDPRTQHGGRTSWR